MAGERAFRPGPAYEPDIGRDIALRCPRPRSSGRNYCAAERGVDGAARRPYQVQGVNTRKNVSENSLLVWRDEGGLRKAEPDEGTRLKIS
jgi:hypothetical protein